MTTTNSLGAYLRKLRLRKYYGQREIADKVGIDPTYLSKIENDHMKPSCYVIRGICYVLRVSEKEKAEAYRKGGICPECGCRQRKPRAE